MTFHDPLPAFCDLFQLSAVMYGRDDSVTALLEASADPNAGAGQAPPAICAAAAMGNGINFMHFITLKPI